MNLDIYTSEMAKSVWDKAFFMDKIPGAKCVIDFGCADGAMIRYLAPLFPDITFIGYDINKELIERARNKAPYYHNVIFTNDHATISPFVHGIRHFNSEDICINFSSVLHEVFSSTGGQASIKSLIDLLHPKYITIRDMYSDEENLLSPENLEYFIPIWAALPLIQRDEFIASHGKMKSWNDLIHLLMKLQWKDNGWEDELKEDYFSWTIDEFLSLIGEYNVCFESHYQLPYLTEMWKKEYDWYNPDIHTHAQFILRRNE